MSKNIQLTGNERFFDKNDIIVSKTDLKGILTYANKTFLEIADYSEAEVLGQPHSILRHPDMPRCVFKLLWDTIQAGKEIFAYVVNKTKFGDHYWVLAHVTPSYDLEGNFNGYHSNRRVPDPALIKNVIAPLYASLLAEENKHANAKDGMLKGHEMLVNILKEKGVAYDEFIFSLQG